MTSTAKTLVWVSVFARILTVLLANAHMLYVAATSQSDCVAHVVGGDPAVAGRYSAAKSAC